MIRKWTFEKYTLVTMNDNSYVVVVSNAESNAVIGYVQGYIHISLAMCNPIYPFTSEV